MVAWRVTWPYVATLVVYLAVWWMLVGSHTEQRGRFAAYPAWTFLEMTVRSLAFWAWPWPLGIEHRLVFVSGFDGWAAAAVAGSLGGVVLLAWRCRLRRPLVSWCLVWALAGLVPLAPLPWATVKGLLQENRAAFSAIALAWLTAVAARDLLAALGRVAPRLVRPAAVVGALVFFAGAGVADRARAYVWNDDVRLWEEAVRLAPESRTAHINLGAAYMKVSEFDRAEGIYRRALALTPDEAAPYYALGVLAFRRGRDEEAWALLRKTVMLAPEYAASYGLLGAIALRQQRDQEAAAFFRRTVELDPRHATARANLGLLAQRARDDAGAERWYREAIALDPDQSLARNNLGTLYLSRRQWREALEQFTAVLAVSAEDHDAALNRAVALDALGRRAEARNELASLLTRLPPDERFDHHRRIAAVMVNRMPP
jgi:Flp pilus assembly protein TadD